ncbi:MAG: ABC transporter permease DevC [Brasilonema octagenarum HA4186-MV1]|jgi:putative ABC transport system permease protein|uniref:ABC transporter n=1 Tax=Brasilonema octagenarum UFV-OR1 TaxID=417115 RepID=A0ABX1M5P0_9CYAN|nr:ABC transporter permease DevC [Brasilonema octagenarum]MBW4627122.1 ABC transporter permease DevC [Brasilonema octagenarum HA4186-MV1]NMF63859.1 ABC transporter [Brasilonema octagenarum UFV-OR1]
MTLILPKQPSTPPSLPTARPSHKGIWQALRDRTPLGWLQLKKSKSRLLVAVAGIGFADLLMFAQLGIQAALFDSNTMLNRGMDADIIIRSAQYRDLNLADTLPRRRLYQIKNVPGVQSAEPLYISRVVWKNPQTRRRTQLTLVGQSLDRPAFTFDEINQNLHKLKQPDTFLFDRLSRGQYADVVAQVAAGQSAKTEIQRRTIKVAGLFSLGASFATDGTLVTSPENFLRFFPERSPGQITLGLVKVNPGVDPEQVLAEIKAILPPDTIASTKQQYVDYEQAYWQQTTPIGIVFTFGTVMAFVVGTVIVFQILSTDVNDHMSEYATFKAMGYRDRYLLLIVLEQSLILASLGFIPGLGLALGQYTLIRNLGALPISMTFTRLALVFSLTLVMCMVSGMIATRKLQSADPADNF